MITIKSLLTFALCLFIYSTAFSQSSCTNAPTLTGNQPYTYCTACTGAIWDNTTNVSALDNIYSSVQLQPVSNCFQSWCFKSRYLTTSNYGFSIPSSAIITGIKVNKIGHSNIPNAVQDSTIKLCKNANGMVGGNQAVENYWPITDTLMVYGNENELWGSNWQPEDINSPDFGVWIKIFNSSCQSPLAYIDEVTVTVYYSIGTAICSQTQFQHPLRVYNDAADQELSVSLDLQQGITEANLNVFDVNGRSIFTKTFNGSNFSISTSEFIIGLYFVSVSAGDKKYTVKTMIIK